jgi:hypothetical protein
LRTNDEFSSRPSIRSYALGLRDAKKDGWIVISMKDDLEEAFYVRAATRHIGRAERPAMTKESMQ